MEQNHEQKLKKLQSQFNFDIWYAEAWSKKQGYFSTKIANNLIKLFRGNQMNVGSILDVCSGSGEFISNMRNICDDCVGVDNSKAYIEYTKNKYHDVKLEYVPKLNDFNLKRTFNVVTCNHDVVNMFTKFSEWETFFKTVNKHLVKNGLFVFDFYTAKKLNGWTDLIYEQDEAVDYVSKVYQSNGLCVQNEVYYVKESSIYYRKTGDVQVEAWFDNEQIFNALKKAGFENINVLDFDFNPIQDIEAADRIHIVCSKK